MVESTMTAPLVQVELSIQGPALLLTNFTVGLVEEGVIPGNHPSNPGTARQQGTLLVPATAIPAIREKWQCFARYYPNLTFAEPVIREPLAPAAPLGPDE